MGLQKIGVKKAQGFEAWFFVIVILLAFSLFFIVLNMAWGKISDPLNVGLNGSVPEADRNTITTAINQTGSAGLMFDKLIPFLIIGLLAFVLILAGSIMKHPIMIIVGIIILGVCLMLAAIYSNMYNEITSTEEFAETKADMPIQDIFMHYMPTIVFIMAIGIVVAIIWSRKSSGGYSGI